ncbi:MAG: hemolysin III family protein [Bryobacteraceae bacterium]|nr:hemolysin III family protein [Bryobacteraceae bacterium]
MTSTLTRQTVGEEIANSVTHGVAAALSIAALVILVVFAALRGNAWHVVSCAVFGVTLILLYLASTLYHALPPGKAKQVFRILDHASIYLLIAGTYTPFTLVTLRGPWGWSIFGVVWALAVAGVVFQSLLIGRLPALSTTVYVLMGWVVVIAARPLIHALPWGGLLWMLAGGLAYTLGVYFFASKTKFAHMVWHLFVIAGSLCHFFAVLFYVIPRG